MRMAGPDVVLFLVGALLLGGASAAIVTTEGGLGALTGGGSPLGVYRVAYNTDAHEGEEEAVASFASYDGDFVVNQTDITRVVVVVSCSDAFAGGGAAPFRLTITVTPPPSSNLTGEEVTANCSGEIEVPVDVAPVPPATTVEGSTEDEARENLGADANATRAQGGWTVSITGTRGPAGALPVAGAPGGSVKARVEGWHPEFTPVPK